MFTEKTLNLIRKNLHFQSIRYQPKRQRQKQAFITTHLLFKLEKISKLSSFSRRKTNIFIERTHKKLSRSQQKRRTLDCMKTTFSFGFSPR